MTPDSELHRQARELPRSVEPERDLWPGIEARIRDLTPVKGHIGPRDPHRPDDTRHSRPQRPRWGWTLGLAMAAGMAGLVAGGLLTDPAAQPETQAPLTGVIMPVSAQEQIRAVESAYEPDLAVLRLLVESTDLAPETRQVLDESLAEIEAAIDEARRALEADPGALRAVDGLRRMYDAKVETLRLAANQPSRT